MSVIIIVCNTNFLYLLYYWNKINYVKIQNTVISSKISNNEQKLILNWSFKYGKKIIQSHYNFNVLHNV